MNSHTYARPVAAALLLSVAMAAGAQTPAKGIADDTASAIRSGFDGLGRWISGLGAAAADTIAPPPAVQIQGLPPLQPAANLTPYEPVPVILGEPAIQLSGATAASIGKGWGSSMNYQGMQVRLVVLDSTGRQHAMRPMSAPIRFGERFKLMVMPTFDAIATIDDVHGSGWSAQRGSQAYPAAGSSVPLKAGQATLLPAGSNYFVADRDGARRFVLNVRHANAVGDARSTQPAYRQDNASGSSYLQLVPRSTYPAFEQLLVAGSR